MKEIWTICEFSDTDTSRERDINTQPHCRDFLLIFWLLYWAKKLILFWRNNHARMESAKSKMQEFIILINIYFLKDFTFN